MWIKLMQSTEINGIELFRRMMVKWIEYFTYTTKIYDTEEIIKYVL